MKLAFFAACAPGLEPLLAAEVTALGIDARAVAGGVEASGDQAAMARLLVDLGLASHLLVRVASFHVRELGALEQHVGRLPWSGWLSPGVPRRVRATAQRSRIQHTGAIRERVLRAIASRLGDDLVDGGDPDGAVPLVVRVFEDRCTISLDASGEPLHRRGYRLDPHRAPLREDLARALVIASRWDAASLLVDPMCGSGTIAIEAALLATDRAPGLMRRFAVEDTPLDDGPDGKGAALAAARDEAQARVRPAVAPILARDRDAGAIEAARANAARAGVAAAIAFEVGALSTTIAAVADVGPRGETPRVVTNPPWGERLGARGTLAPLYRALGQLRRALGDAGGLAIAAHDRRLAYGTGIPMQSAFMSDLGGLKVHAMIETPPR